MRRKILKAGWTSKKLEELGFLGRGKSKHRPRNDPSLYGGKYPFIQTGEVKETDLYVSKYSKSYNEKGLAQSKLWKSGTLLLTIAANVAETAILKVDACFPDSIAGFIANPQIADARFVKYYIDTIKLQMQSISRGTTQDNLSLEKIRSFDFLVPPLPIQRKIAAILSAYDDLIENNNRRIEILEEMARMLYREWFVKFRYPGHESDRFYESELGLIPQGWEVVKLGETCNLIMGQSPKSEFYNENLEGLPFHQGVANFGNRFPTDKFYCTVSKRVAEAGDILFSVRAPVGRINLANKKIVIGRGLCAIRSKSFSQIFLFQQLKDKFQEEDTMGSGTIYNSVTKNDMREIKLLRPRLRLVKKFDFCAKPIFQNIEVLIKKNNNLRQTRDLLLPRLISGEIDVENLDIKVINN